MQMLSVLMSASASRRAALLACACLALACHEARVEPDAGLAEPDAEPIAADSEPTDEQDAADSAEGGAEPPPDPADAEPRVDPTDAGEAQQLEDAATDAPATPDGEITCRTPDVDLLFVIDNSGSMTEEQQKLARQLPELLGVLATGNHDGRRSAEGEPTDFAPAQSIHVGVVSTDLGVNLAPAIESCGGASYSALAPDPANTTASVRIVPQNNERLDKPLGDDGALLTSTEVAEAGIWARAAGLTFATPVSLVVEPDPSCAPVRPDRPWLEYAPGDRFEDTQHAFSCIAKLGKNGCGLEQQLESMFKALAPSTELFSRGTHGQGTAPGVNAGFLRDDAILAVVIISDEDDCSIPDGSSDLFNRTSVVFQPGDINTRCGKAENQRLLHPTSRYVEGLRALKSEANQGRIIVASITGLPLAEALDGSAVHSGAELEEILQRPDMQFMTRPSSISASEHEPVPACASAQGDSSAAPGRRFLELAQAFGDNGVAASICEEDYGALVTLLSERIVRHLGSCE